MVFRFPHGIFAALSLLTAAAYADPPDSPVKKLMLEHIIPASSGVFAAAAETPTDAAGWRLSRSQALELQSAALALSRPPQALNEAEWRKDAAALLKAAGSMLATVEARDTEHLGDAANTLFEACEACHKTYLKPK